MPKRYKTFDELTYTDDFMFKKVMTDPSTLPAVKWIIELATNRKIKKIKLINGEQTIESGYLSRGVRLDVLFEGDGNIYDIEMQTYNDDLYKRAEYYHSSIDIETVDKGLNFNKVPHKYLIYILTNNFLEFKDPIIHEEMRIIEHLELPTRGYRTNIYINTTVETKEPNLKSFFDFVQKEEVNHPMTNLLSETIMKVQGNNESRRTFMDIVNTRRIEREEARADGLKEGKIEGANNRTKEICINMINRGMNVNDIAELTGLSLDAIQDIKKSV